MSNYKLIIVYNGSHFFGSQYQKSKRTVQGEICEALYRLYNKKIKLVFAGRTDAGVHAVGQVANYYCEKRISTTNILRALNSFLAKDVYIRQVEEVDAHFDARRSAKIREYRYLFSNEDIPIYLKDYVAYFNYKIYVDKLSEIEEIMVGEKDFKRFRKMGSREKTTIRKIYDFKISIREIEDLYRNRFKHFEVKICANSYLYRMVRNIVGAIFEVLKGKKTIADFKKLFYDNKCEFIYKAAPANGLCLVSVNY